jgi:hypothetical protein
VLTALEKIVHRDRQEKKGREDPAQFRGKSANARGN